MLKNTVWHCKYYKCCTNAEEYCATLQILQMLYKCWRILCDAMNGAELLLLLEMSVSQQRHPDQLEEDFFLQYQHGKFSQRCQKWSFVTLTIILIIIILTRMVVKSTTLHCLSKSQSKIESPALLSLTTGFTSIESAALIIIIIIAMNVLFSFLVLRYFGISYIGSVSA